MAIWESQREQDVKVDSHTSHTEDERKKRFGGTIRNSVLDVLNLRCL